MPRKKEVKTETKEKNLGGRPSKLPLIDEEQFKSMCEIQCTKDEICAILKIDEKTLTKWCNQTYSMGFSDVYKKLSSTGKMSLRRQQFKSAENGNVTMQIWLGKQYLGQTDKVEEKITNTEEKLANGLLKALNKATGNE